MFHSSRLFLFIALFIILNLLSNYLFLRVDLTQGQIYTLSPASKEIVNKLDQQLEIKAFISQQLPPQFVTTRNLVNDRLTEYQKINPGKIKLTFVDPVKDNTAATLAQALGIPALDLQVIEKDQARVVKAYFGLAVLKNKEGAQADLQNPLAQYDKYEVLPVVENLGNFEYDIASLLLKVGGTSQKTIGLLSGHGEHSLAMPQQYAAMNNDPRADYPLSESLSRNYQIKSVEFTAPAPVAEGETPPAPEDPLKGIDTLLVAGPSEEIPADQIAKIQDFVTKGGHAIFLLDSMNIDTQYGFNASALKNNYNALIEKWGLKIEPKLIADAKHDYANFNQGYITYTLPYPFFVKASNLSRQNSITQDLEALTLPWPSPIAITTTQEVATEILATTSEQYQLFTEEDVTVAPTADNANPTPQTKPISLDPQQNFSLQNAAEPRPLVVVAQKKGEGKIILVGDSDFVTQGNVNLVFLLNSIDALTLGTELISIRSKGVSGPALKELTDSSKAFMRWGLIIGVPLLFVLYGLYRRYHRRQLKSVKL